VPWHSSSDTPHRSAPALRCGQSARYPQIFICGELARPWVGDRARVKNSKDGIPTSTGVCGRTGGTISSDKDRVVDSSWRGNPTLVCQRTSCWERRREVVCAGRCHAAAASEQSVAHTSRGQLFSASDKKDTGETRPGFSPAPSICSVTHTRLMMPLSSVSIFPFSMERGPEVAAAGTVTYHDLVRAIALASGRAPAERLELELPRPGAIPGGFVPAGEMSALIRLPPNSARLAS